MERLGIDFPLLSDPDRRVISAYGVADARSEVSVPAVFVVASDGTVAWRAIGTSMRELPPLQEILDAARRAVAHSTRPVPAPGGTQLEEGEPDEGGDRAPTTPGDEPGSEVEPTDAAQ